MAAMHVHLYTYANIQNCQSTHLAKSPDLVIFQSSPPSGQRSHVGSDLCEVEPFYISAEQKQAFQAINSLGHIKLF